MASLSDPASFTPQETPPAQKRGTSAWLAFLGEQAQAAGEFAPHPRFAAEQAPTPEPVAAPETPVDDTESRIAEAFERGKDAGRAEALAAAEAETGERRKLGIALRRLEGDMRDQFAAMLSETVTALCEASFASIALDTEMLASRCERAAAMLEEAQDAITLRLHPDDIARLDEEFRAQWSIAPDPDLAQGELRAEGREGAVLDGPREWARTLAEALEKC